MKSGKAVVYVDGKGKHHDAVVLAIVGAGASGYKLLDLSVGKRTYKSVGHANDYKPPHWLESGDAHAVSVESSPEVVPASVVPESSDEGRATAEVGDSGETDG